MRRTLVPAAILIVGLVGVVYWFSVPPRGERGHDAAAGMIDADGVGHAPTHLAEGRPTLSTAGTETTPVPEASGTPGAAVPLEVAFPIVAPLNRPDSTIARDLETLQAVLDAWRSNFPAGGNPVGGNAEITAALAGDNPLQLVLVPREHPAINAGGELCDRWGTPFRFHAVSGDRMEIRSAGPDRRFATEDDAVWNPAP